MNPLMFIDIPEEIVALYIRVLAAVLFVAIAFLGLRSALDGDWLGVVVALGLAGYNTWTLLNCERENRTEDH